jgi:hypothetical protein
MLKALRHTHGRKPGRSAGLRRGKAPRGRMRYPYLYTSEAA